MSTTTPDRLGVRAQHRHARFSATKAREVLDLVRGKPVGEARTILQFCDRGAAEPVAKVLDSAVANAVNNNDIPPDELFISTCYADEGPTLKRWRPRARGRATRINKRTCHITIVVSRFTVDELDRFRARQERTGRTSTDAATSRARRVARSRAKQAEEAPEDDDELATVDPAAEDAGDEAATDAVVEEAFAEDAEGAEDAEAATDTGSSEDEDDGPDPDAAAEDAGDEAATDAVVEEAFAQDDSGDEAGDADETDEKDA